MKNMRFTINLIATLMLAAIISLPLSAQEEKEQISTLFGGSDGKTTHGGWAGLTFGYTKVGGKDTYLMGARGGWLINHHVTIGLAGTGIISDGTYNIHPYINKEKSVGADLAGGYGGLFFETTIAPMSPLHVTIPVIIGAGGIAYINNNWNGDDAYDPDHNDYNNDTYDSDAYFVFEPGIEVELNLMKFMRFAIGGSYRYTSNINMVDSSKGMLRGFNGTASLKFGWF